MINLQWYHNSYDFFNGGVQIIAIRCLTLVTRSSAPPCCLTAESFPAFETSTFDWFRSISSDKLSNYLTVWDFKTVNYSRLSFYILIADFSIPETSFYKPVAVLCPLSRLWHTADRAAGGSRSCCFDWSRKFWRSLNRLGVAFGRLWKSWDGLEGWDKCIVLPCAEMPRYLAEWWQKPSICRSIAEEIGHWRVFPALRGSWARRLSVLLELRAYAKWTQAAEWRAIWRQAELVKHSRIEIWLLLIEIFCTITIIKCRKSGWRECKAKQLFHIIYYWNLRMVN